MTPVADAAILPPIERSKGAIVRVLVTGASGFIGSRLVGRLLTDGHAVVGAVRDPGQFRLRFPGVDAVLADLNRDKSPAVWIPRLAGIDAVVNCAGALQSGRGQNLMAIHYTAPAALFDACLKCGVRRVVQISAISADAEAGTEYATSKLAGDEHLMSLDLDWVVLRPSLVYGPGSFGGTSLLRSLAAIPLVVPVPGAGDQAFQPIHIDDIAESVAILLRDRRINRQVLEPVGPERLTLTDIVLKLRGWFGLPPARLFQVPLHAVRTIGRIGDLLGAGPFRTTAVRQLLHGNVGDPDAFAATIGFRPRSMDESFSAHPAGTQDLWHARLYPLRPLLRFGLAAFWLWSGFVTLFLARPESEALLNAAGLSDVLMAPALWLGGLLDIALGLWLVVTRRAALVCGVMIIVTLAYLVAISAGLPRLWLDPLGAVSKTAIIMLATLVLMALSRER